MVTVGFPIYNRYDLLPQVVQALVDGNRKPDKIVIVDNGLKFNNKMLSLVEGTVDVQVLSPSRNMGVAYAWNKIIEYSKGSDCIIMNDDILVHKDTIYTMTNTTGYVVCCSPLSAINAFSLFAIRPWCVEAVGLFDESISPEYAYYEDNDFAYRMKLLDLEIVRAEVGADHIHGGSATFKKFTKEEEKVHHFRFRLAQSNYIKKWGGLPTEEKYLTPYNK